MREARPKLVKALKKLAHRCLEKSPENSSLPKPIVTLLKGGSVSGWIIPSRGTASHRIRIRMIPMDCSYPFFNFHISAVDMFFTFFSVY
jgi:hypothetical protein